MKMATMKKYLPYLLLSVLLLGAFWGGALFGTRGDDPEEQAEPGRRILYYVDPMNPAHTSSEPGLAPCGMKMEPVYADDDAGDGGLPGSLPPGTARITPEKQQLIGVRVEKAGLSNRRHVMRALGRITADENLTYRISAAGDGWVWGVSEATTGSLVNRDQLVAKVFYNRYLNIQEDYLRALEYNERRKEAVKDGGEEAAEESFIKTASSFGGLNAAGKIVYNLRDQLEVSKLELYSLGVGETQIKEMNRHRRIVPDIEVRSPVQGFVLSRNISTQQRFRMGEELFRIADLSRVWILAEVFEGQAPYIHPGMTAKVTLPHQNQVFEARVANVPPLFDPGSRTYKVRLETDNPEFVLRPDMFVDVEFEGVAVGAVIVPVDSLVDSGLTKTVFVETRKGYFEPRTVETGRHFGDRVEIVRGLMPGEPVAVSGTFFIDSESRMKMGSAHVIASAMPPMDHANHQAPSGKDVVKDPVCGMDVSPDEARKKGLTSQFEGKTYFFCAEQCKRTFDREHGIEADKPDAKQPVVPLPKVQSAAADIVKDPVCGMDVQPAIAEAAGLKSTRDGKPYYFCNESCKTRFDQAPEPFLKGQKQLKPQNLAQNPPIPPHEQSMDHEHGGHGHD
ncbi:MAG: efflux RND transporter periplasmic adaptor subunit [Syntrophotaleaceae bacterium]